MRKRKDIQIEGIEKRFELRELTVRQILDLFSADREKSGLAEMLDGFLSMASNATREDLIAMAPSEIEQVKAAFLEVNAAFFAQARALGLGEAVKQFQAALVEDFGKLLAG